MRRRFLKKSFKLKEGNLKTTSLTIFNVWSINTRKIKESHQGYQKGQWQQELQKQRRLWRNQFRLIQKRPSDPLQGNWIFLRLQRTRYWKMTWRWNPTNLTGHNSWKKTMSNSDLNFVLVFYLKILILKKYYFQLKSGLH